MNADALDAIAQAEAALKRARAALLNTAPTPSPGLPQPEFRVAVVVGHEPTKPGAGNRAANVYEFEFNDWIADQMLKAFDGDPVIKAIKVHRHPGNYSQLPAKINALKPDLVISLHANGFDGEATGTEMLYAEGSERGKRFAGLLQQRVLVALGLRDRGVKSRVKSDRGAHLLYGVTAPAVIVEPFFIDNNSDFGIANANITNLVNAYVAAIREYRNP